MDRKQKLALFHLTHFRCSGEYNNECNDDFDAGDLRWGEGSLGYGSFYGFFCRGCFEKICSPGVWAYAPSLWHCIEEALEAKEIYLPEEMEELFLG